MYRRGQIVLDCINMNPSIIVGVKARRNLVLIMDLKTYQRRIRKVSDIQPLDPDDNGGAGGGIAQVFNEDEIDSLMRLLNENIILAEPDKIRYRNSDEFSVIQKIFWLHEILFEKEMLSQGEK